jgi:DNA-binding transcriptional regulator YhcF (GntR family)
VLQALLDVVKRAGRLGINASHRELTEMTGLARGTVRASLKRLEAQGFIQVIDERRSLTDAFTYVVVPEVLDALADSLDPPSTHPEYPGVSLSVDDALGHDLWRNKSGLGKGTGLTWQALTDTPQSVATLAQARGVGADTIRRHLKALQDYGLTRATREGWVRHNNQPQYLDSLAKNIGVLGRGNAQKQVHAAERATFTIRQRTGRTRILRRKRHS